MNIKVKNRVFAVHAQLSSRIRVDHVVATEDTTLFGAGGKLVRAARFCNVVNV